MVNSTISCHLKLFVFSFMLNVYASHCWILRLPCKTESNFEVKLEGHILKNCVLEESSVTTVEQCFEKCENHAKCKSVNHKHTGENNCQLNSKLKEVSPAIDFTASSSWTYYATNHNTTNIGTFCADYTPCPPWKYCIDTCRCPGYQCLECDPGYTFNTDLQCTDMNECESNPCTNGGTCMNHVNRFQCTCLPGYSGVLCEVDINECDSTPCKNKATCLDQVNKFQCTCSPGYSGSLCEVDINECDSDPCQHGATCDNQVNGFQCTCMPGYSGVHCEVDTNECASNPCGKGGQCTDHVNRFTCTCLPNYTGLTCQTKIPASCDDAYKEGKRLTGTYGLTIGNHYCLLDGWKCGSGGWTLAMKSTRYSGIFYAYSPYWTSTSRVNEFRTSLSEYNAKFRAFSELSFNTVCLVMKYGSSQYKALVVNQTGTSLRSIFQGEQLETKLSREKWLDLLPGSGLQPNCNRNGFNMKRDDRNHIVVRFGIIGNNENDCRTPDSALGIGIDLSYYSLIRTGNVNYRSLHTSAMAYLFVK